MKTPHQPAYSQIATGIQLKIENKEFNPGDRLPSERELAEQFGVARMTVRQALDQLQMDGTIARKRGRNGGSFVMGNRPVVELTHMEGFLPQLSARDHSVASIILGQDLMTAPAEVAHALHLDPAAEVVRIIRLRKVDDTPLLMERSYFPAHLVPGMLEHDLSGSLYRLLDRQWQRGPVRKEETIAPGVATQVEQEHLEVSSSMPLLRITRVAYAADDTPVEYSADVLRSDAAQIKVITRQAAGR